MARLNGRPVICHVVGQVLGSRLRPVFVVLGHENETIEHLLKKRFGSFIKKKSLRMVINPAWSQGKSSSRAAALAALPKTAPGAVFLLGDMPFVGAKWIDRLVGVFERTGKICFARHGDAVGPPAAFPRSLFEALGKLRGDRSVLNGLGLRKDSYCSVAVRRPLAQADIDTRSSLRLFNRRGEVLE